MANPITVMSKILIVDDEPFNVDYLEQELGDLDYETISATNGRDALVKIESELPDLVLLDIMMPIMDGFEVLSRLKVNPLLSDIPVIVISASNDLQSIIKGIKLGAEDYLPKPFEPTLLLARVSSSLEKKHLRDLQKKYLKSLEREFEIAREIQKDFLPSEISTVEGWEISAYFKAAHEVAGDYYDTFLLPDGNLVFLVGDVCGKGVGAALFMTLFRSLIRATSMSEITSGGRDMQVLTPAERLVHVISFINYYLNETHGDSNMFSTIFIGILDPHKNVISYLNGGNEAPLLVRNGNVIATLAPTGPVVGVFPGVEFEVKEVRIEKDDLLLAYTDGISDAIDENNESFGNGRVIAAVSKPFETGADLLNELQNQLVDHIGTADPFDDITLMVVKRNV